MRETVTYPIQGMVGDDARAVAEGHDGVLAVTNGTNLILIDPMIPQTPLLHMDQDKASQITAIQFDSHSGIMVTVGKDCALRVFAHIETSSLTPITKVEKAHDDWVIALQFDPESGMIVSA